MLLRGQTDKKSLRKSLKKSSVIKFSVDKVKGEDNFKEKRKLNNVKCHKEPKWDQG